MKLLLIICLFLPLASRSATTTFVPKDELPVEFSYLVESLQLYPLQDKEREDLSKVIKELDNLFSQMSKEEVFFILKSELYKELLNKPRLTGQTQLYDKKILRKFMDLIDTKIDNYHQFAKWIIFATYSDLKQIFDSPYFNTFIVEKRGIGFNNPNAAKIGKKFDLVLPWYEDIINQNPEEFHEMLKPVMLNFLKKIHKKLEILLTFSRFESIKLAADDHLKYFELKSIEPKAPKKDPILDMEISTEKALEPEKDQWKPRNEPMAANPNYIAPEKLPTPSDDW